METVLYLSDLDGTLLDREARLPPEDAEKINRMTAAGVKIAFATARTVRSVSAILRAIDFSLPGSAPAALMNGVMIRDMRLNRYLSIARIAPESVLRVLSALDRTGAEPFVYSVNEAAPVDGDPLATSYRRIANGAMRDFRDERIRKYAKPFLTFSSPADLHGDTVFFCVLGDEELVRRTAEETGTVPGIRQTFYRDAYRPDVWYLEIFSETASKRKAAEFLRSRTGADRVVAFGDNRNDLPMFEAADFSVAVSSARDEVKAAADDICGNVPDWILSDLKRRGIPL